MHANDLRDQRDVLVDSLSKIVKINVVESADGQVNINVGNHQLVDRQTRPSDGGQPGRGRVYPGPVEPDKTAATVVGSNAPGTIAGTLTINGIAVDLTAIATPRTPAGDCSRDQCDRRPWRRWRSGGQSEQRWCARADLDGSWFDR